MTRRRIVLEGDTFEVEGRRFKISEIQGAATEQRSGSVVVPAAIGAVSGVLVIPGLIAVLGRTRDQEVEQLLYLGLFLAAVALFGSIGKLLFSEERYALVLATARGPRVALVSDDPSLVSGWLVRLNDRRAQEASRPGPRTQLLDGGEDVA